MEKRPETKTSLENTTENSKKTPLEKKLQEAIKNKESDFYNSEDINKINNVLKELEDNAENEPEFRKALNGVKLADKLNSRILGKIVYQDFKKIKPKKGREFVNKIPNEYAFDATVESGFHSFVSWDKRKGNFYIESKNRLDKIVEEINKINPNSNMSTLLDKNNANQIIGQINNMTEEEFKSILLMGNDEHKPNKTEKEIPPQSEENKKDNTETKIDEEVNPEIIPQTERQKRIAELLKNQEERDEQIQALEKQLEDLRTILMEIQEQEIKEKITELENQKKLEIEKVLKENRVEITDKNFDLKVFGTTNDYISSLDKETSERNRDYDFYQLFYDGNEQKRSLELILRPNEQEIKTYSYVYKVNADLLTSNESRHGAFFGMGVELKNIRITDLDKFKNLLEETFQKLIIEKYGIVKKIAPFQLNDREIKEAYQFNIKDFKSQEKQIAELKGIIRKNLQTVLKNDILKQNEPLIKDGRLNLTNAKSKVFDFERNEINAKYDKQITELKEKILKNESNTETLDVKEKTDTENNESLKSIEIEKGKLEVSFYAHAPNGFSEITRQNGSITMHEKMFSFDGIQEGISIGNIEDKMYVFLKKSNLIGSGAGGKERRGGRNLLFSIGLPNIETSKIANPEELKEIINQTFEQKIKPKILKSDTEFIDASSARQAISDKELENISDELEKEINAKIKLS
ncbi:MAG: hypothetical protein WC011_03830 [Candidatus Paceibacterota bacterium]